MSLINDALKRVEKSLNENSPGEHSKQQMPPLTFESSSRNKKLFLIALIGGTLFFSILILLLVLVFSNTTLTQSSNLTPTLQPNTPSFVAMIKDDETKINPVEQSLQTSPPVDLPTNQNQLNSDIPNESQKTSIELATNEIPNLTTNTEPVTATDQEEPSDTASAQKNLNQEFFESILNLASKAFVTKASGPTATDTTSTTSEKSSPPAPKENYNLSTAQKTLDRIEQESQQPKSVPETPVQKFIDSLSITGVMISDKDSMVLINNRVYLKDAIINSDLNLRLTEIHPQNIVLQDNSGASYTVTF